MHGDATSGLNGELDILAVNYSEILSMTESISAANTKYSEGLAQVNADLALSVDERMAKISELTAAHNAATYKMIADNMLQKLSIDGLTQAEFEKVIAFQEATALITPEAAAQALVINKIVEAAVAGKISVNAMKDAIDNVQSKTVTLTLRTVQETISGGGAFEHVTPGSGRAAGTKGWETVPPGYPNDSYPIMLTSGEKFAVVPNGGMGGGAPTNMSSGGNNYYITLSMAASPVTISDEQKVKSVLLPYIIDGIRQAQAQGAIK